MKKLRINLSLIALASALSMLAKDDFGLSDLDFSPFYTQYKYEVECKSNDNGGRQGNIICVYQDMKHNTMNKGLQPYRVSKTSGGVSMSNDASTVRVGSQRKRQQQVEKQMRDNERREFFERRAAERMEAARQAAARKRAIKARNIARDNQRASKAYAAKNAQLQGLTNQRMASDQWHATQGRQAVQQVARQQIGAPRGMTVTQRAQTTQRSTGSARAMAMQANKQRERKRVHKAPQPVSPAKYRPRPPRPVRQRPNPHNGKYVFTGRATKSSIFIERDPQIQIVGAFNGPAMARSGHQFRLSPNATVTTGQLVDSPVFKMPGKIPPPVTRVKPSRTHEELMDEIIEEILGPDPE